MPVVARNLPIPNAIRWFTEAERLRLVLCHAQGPARFRHLWIVLDLVENQYGNNRNLNGRESVKYSSRFLWAITVCVLALAGCGGGSALVAGSSSSGGGTSFQALPQPVFPVGAILDPGESEGIAGFALEDMDGNGLIDVIVARSGSPQLPRDDFVIFYQQAPGDFAQASTPTGGPGISDDLEDLAVGDLNSDGLLDVATANDPEDGEGEDGITVFTQDAFGGFANQLLQDTLGTATCSPAALSIGDFDSNGSGDLALVGGFGLTLYYQDESSFQLDSNAPYPTVSSGENGSCLAVGDVNLDGSVDVVMGTNFGNLHVFVQLPEGGFKLEGDRPIGKLPRPYALDLIDLDQDGQLELVAANFDNCILTVHRRAFGEFTREPIIVGDPFESANPIGSAAADMNADGKLDLLSANATADQITIFSQLSPLEFSLTGILGNSAFTSSPSEVCVADLDGVNGADVISINFNDVTIFYASVDSQ